MTETEPNPLPLPYIIVGEGEVTRHPNCPVCGEEGCEIVHVNGNEEA